MAFVVAPEAAASAVDFHYVQTDSFVALLHQLGASLLSTKTLLNASR